MSLTVKIMLLELASSLSLSFADKTQRFMHIVVFSKVPFAPSASVSPYSLVSYLKNLEALLSTISALKWVASSLE